MPLLAAISSFRSAPPRILLVLALSLTFIQSTTQANAEIPMLTQLEKQSKTDTHNIDEILSNSDAINTGVEKLIQEDKLVSAEDFRRAGILADAVYSNEITKMTRRYQLLLVAAVMGDPKAAEELSFSWDRLIRATGRPYRIGTTKLNEGLMPQDFRWVDPAPESIRKVLLDPSAAKTVAATASDNAEVKKLVDADQAFRQLDWSKFTAEDRKKGFAEDHSRFQRILEIIKSGDLKTSADFANAALVCQHGEHFLDFALAHELSLCSMLLGRKESAWLAGASYDRMLLDASYPQSFATQYRGSDNKMSLQTYTTSGINDRMRKTVTNKTLDEAKNRKFE